MHSFTSREKTAFYGTCLTKDVPKLVEIISDAIVNPKLSDADLEKERQELLRDSSDVETNLKEVVNIAEKFSFINSNEMNTK